MTCSSRMEGSFIHRSMKSMASCLSSMVSVSKSAAVIHLVPAQSLTFFWMARSDPQYTWTLQPPKPCFLYRSPSSPL